MSALDFASVLAEHDDWDYAPDPAATPICACGNVLTPTGDKFSDDLAAHRAHLQAVLLAHVGERLNVTVELTLQNLRAESGDVLANRVEDSLTAHIAALVGVDS